MWVFLSNRFRRWVLLAVALPLASRVARGAGDRLQSRAGHPTTASKVLNKAGGLAGGRGRRR